MMRSIRDPEAVILVAHFLDPEWSAPHMALFEDSSYYVTMRGLRTVYADGKTFDQSDVCARIDAAHEGSRGQKPLFPMLGDKQHERAVRRLLEGSVGTAKHGLYRYGRWRYYFGREE